MKHMSLRLPRQKRNHQQLIKIFSHSKLLWLQILRRLPAAFKSQWRQKRTYGKVRLNQLSDRELKDIGLTRDSLIGDRIGIHTSVQHNEANFQHKALRELQSGLIRHLPRDN